MVGKREIATGGDTIGNSDIGHPGCLGRLDPVDRVLNDKTGRGVNSQALSGLEIEVGGGLYPRGIIAADGDIEVVQKADFAQPPIDPAMG